MRWYNYDTGEIDTHTSYPEVAEEWEPYIPVLRRTEYWLRLNQPDTILERVVYDILNAENNKEIPASDILPPTLSNPKYVS